MVAGNPPSTEPVALPRPESAVSAKFRERVSVPCGRVPCVINDLDSINWSSMSHAYGTAVDVPWLQAMASPDPEVPE